MRTRREVTPAEIRQVHALVKEGRTVNWISGNMGRSWETVDRIVKMGERVVAVKKPKKPAKPVALEIVNKALQDAHDDPITVALRNLVDLLVQHEQGVVEVHIIVPTRSCKLHVHNQIEIMV